MLQWKRGSTMLAVALATLALAAGAQAATNPGDAPTPAATSGTAAHAAKAAPSRAAKHHAAKHHARLHKASHVRRHTAQAAVGSSESAYRAALRLCVTGPAARRDDCLDQAIATHDRA